MTDPAVHQFSEAPTPFEGGPFAMEIKARKWGASVGVVIPANVAEALNIKDGTPLNLELTSRGLTLAPRPVYPGLEELLESIPDGETAGFGLALPDRAPPAYVATLFDQHAEDFDDILVARLGYDVPALARKLVGPHAAGPLRILDLGCGTGLAGVAFADIAGEIVGVDLAEGMLSMADDRGVYDDLYVGDAVAFMAEWDEAPFDLIVAADVWPYLGDLAPFAAAAASALVPGGLLVASSERGLSQFGATKTQRFAHATDYLGTVLENAGFTIAAVEPITVRLEEGEPVAGDLVLARLRATTP